MTSSPPPLREILGPTGTFKRNAKRLPPNIRKELDQAVQELLAGELSPGRNYEQLTNMQGVYSVRLSRSYRFVFSVADGVADPIAVGPHDQAYADGVRRFRQGRNKPERRGYPANN